MADDERDRRIQDAAAIAAMTAQIGNLASAMIRVEAAVTQLLQRIERAEERAQDNCRNCTTWPRLTLLEQKEATHATLMEQTMASVRDHESRLRAIEPRMAAAAALFALLAFAAGKIF